MPDALSLLALILVLYVVGNRPTGGGSGSSGCSPIMLSTLTLPPDKAEANEDFTSKAQRLNDAGKCVIEGSYGTAYQQFYFAVKGRDDPQPYILRFTRDELRR